MMSPHTQFHTETKFGDIIWTERQFATFNCHRGSENSNYSPLRSHGDEGPKDLIGRVDSTRQIPQQMTANHTPHKGGHNYRNAVNKDLCDINKLLK